jgi:hypothetical protein
MGTYATTTSLELVMVGVNFGATNMQTLAAKAIEQAEAEVNKHLSKRYDLGSTTFQTSTSTPPMVRMLTEQIAEGYMWKWLSRGSKESITRGKEQIQEAKENLADILKGSVDLVNTAGSIISPMETGAFRVQCNTSDYTDTFGEDDDTSWAVDSDKLDDIANERD